MRLPNPLVRVVFAGCLLAVAPAVGAGLFGGPPEPGQIPSRFIRFEAVAGGLFRTTSQGECPPGHNIRLGTATCIMGPFRFGLALSDAYTAEPNNQGGIMYVPVHVGYTLWSNPRPEWRFWGTIPDLYVEASCGLLRTFSGGDPMGRAALCLDADYYGLGVRLESGVLANWVYAPSSDYYLYVSLQLRLLTFGIGF